MSAPISRPAPGNENLPPAPTVTPTPGPGNPDPTPIPVPADPKDVAPELDPGAATSVYDATKFLFTGANPIQRDVEPGAIERQDRSPSCAARVPGPRRQADRGRARDRASTTPSSAAPAPAPTASSTSPSTAAASRSSSRPRASCTVQRTLSPNWQDYETARRRRDGPGRPEREGHRPELDASRSRSSRAPSPRTRTASARARCSSPRAPTPRWSCPNGQTKAVGELKIRVTEFTYGDQGDEAMPGSLPAQLRLHVRRRVQRRRGAEGRRDRRSTSTSRSSTTPRTSSARRSAAPVPTGYYDRETRRVEGGRERPRDQGPQRGERHRRRRHRRRRQGRHRPRHDRRRARATSPSLYEPGQELWRVLITHFTPWDHNWPYGPPPGAKPPKLKEFEWKDPNDPCQQQGSAIGCETQTLGESIPVTGTGMTLDYSTERTPGWRVDETLRSRSRAATLPPRLKGIQLHDRRRRRADREALVRPELPDHRREHLQGLSADHAQPRLRVPLGRPGRLRPRDPGPRDGEDQRDLRLRVQLLRARPRTSSRSFGQFGSDTRGLRRPLRVRQPVGLDGHALLLRHPDRADDHPRDRLLGRAARRDGLGGWSLNEHHAYDPVERALRRGDGSTVRAEALPPVVETLAGTTAAASAAAAASGNYPKDGAPANEANIDYLADYVRSPDGNLYLHNGLNRNDIFRVSRDGKIFLFAGNGTKGGAPTGDGGPAKNAGLGTVQHARRGARRRADHRLLRRRLRHGDLPPRVARTARRSRRSRATLDRQRPAGRRQARARGAHRHRQRPDRRARRHDLLDRALQPARRLEGPPAQDRAGRDRHDGRGRRRQAAPRTARRRPRRRSATTRRASRSAPTARSTSRSRTRRRSRASTRPAARSASPARACTTSAAGSSPAARRPSPTSTRR